MGHDGYRAYARTLAKRERGAPGSGVRVSGVDFGVMGCSETGKSRFWTFLGGNLALGKKKYDFRRTLRKTGYLQQAGAWSKVDLGQWCEHIVGGRRRGQQAGGIEGRVRQQGIDFQGFPDEQSHFACCNHGKN